VDSAAGTADSADVIFREILTIREVSSYNIKIRDLD
jgi:hypothetical protein